MFLFSLHVGAEKRALIVAIGSYPVNSGWNKINSENDVPIIKGALMNQGFNSINIDVLINEKATKEGIVKSLDKLISKSKYGDVVVFHFSGHGQQVTDLNGDEIDGKDEALVPYDAPKTNFELASKAKFHLIDDELSVFLNQLRRKVGSKGDVLFFIDACHSGTITRSSENDVFRGTDQVFEIPVYKRTIITESESDYFDEKSDISRSANENLSPFIIISACLANQTNKEYNKTGSLSYAIGKAFSESLDKKSYPSLFNSIRTEMIPLMINSFGSKHNQNPQIEGNTGRMIFGGKTIRVPNHFVVNKLSDNKVIVNAGTLNGIFKGAELSFYPPDTHNRSTSKPYFTAKVDESFLTESSLIIDKGIDRKKIALSWVFVHKYRYITYTNENSNQMRARVLRTIPQNSNNLNFNLIPLKNGKRTSINEKLKNGNINFEYGEQFIFEIKNKNKFPVYFQLINILADNKISLLLENDNYKENYLLKEGESKIFDKNIITVDYNSPVGEETIVIIASEKVLDLTAIQTQDSNIKRSDTYENEEWINVLFQTERSGLGIDNKKVFTNRVSYIVKTK